MLLFLAVVGDHLHVLRRHLPLCSTKTFQDSLTTPVGLSELSGSRVTLPNTNT